MSEMTLSFDRINVLEVRQIYEKGLVIVRYSLSNSKGNAPGQVHDAVLRERNLPGLLDRLDHGETGGLADNNAAKERRRAVIRDLAKAHAEQLYGQTTGAFGREVIEDDPFMGRRVVGRAQNEDIPPVIPGGGLGKQ